MTTIAFATCAARPEITSDDARVMEHLPADVALVGVPWDTPDADWSAFDAVVLRSTWDYHLRRREFALWLERLDTTGVKVWNPTAIVRWNLEKTYLRELTVAGVETVPTIWLGPGEKPDLAAIRAERGWDRLVVKPTVGASSWGLRVVDAGAAAGDRAALEAMRDGGGVMIQPLLGEVARDGEWSLVFLGGELSHAVVKRARGGDVRVQSDFGGSVDATPPPPELARWAAGCLERSLEQLGRERSAQPPLYARVDAVRTATGPLLMELELIEPQLFLGSDGEAPARFAAALETVVGAG